MEEKVAHYREAIIGCLRTDVAVLSPADGIEAVVVADTSNDNYLLIELGWGQRGRIHTPLIHIRLHDKHVSIEYDGTEEGITLRLIEAGIRPEDIELGFVRPSIGANSA